MRMSRARARVTSSGRSPFATRGLRLRREFRAQASAVPRMTGPQPRMPAATAPCSELGAASSVMRATCAVGVSPCSAMATSSRSRKKRCASVGSRPVTRRKKYSVKVSRPIRSRTRSRPRISIRSASALQMALFAGPGLPISIEEDSCHPRASEARPEGPGMADAHSLLWVLGSRFARPRMTS